MILRFLRNCSIAVALFFVLSGVHARDEGHVELISAKNLPSEARETLRLIYSGGPFPYTKDGAVFGNYEHYLPKKHRGYYREYTVRTLGARNRGAKRIIVGGEKNSQESIYYTDDHYATFKRINEQ